MRRDGECGEVRRDEEIYIVCSSENADKCSQLFDPM